IERDHALFVKTAPCFRLKHAAHGFCDAFFSNSTLRDGIAQRFMRTLNVWHVEHNIASGLNRLHSRFACLVTLYDCSHVQGVGEDYAFEAEVAAKYAVNNRGRERCGTCSVAVCVERGHCNVRGHNGTHAALDRCAKGREFDSFQTFARGVKYGKKYVRV